MNRKQKRGAVPLTRAEGSIGSRKSHGAVATMIVGAAACIVALGYQPKIHAMGDGSTLGPIVVRRAPGDASDPWAASMRQARYWRAMASRAAHIERYRVEPWDRMVGRDASAESERRAALAKDHSGHLGHAHYWILQAVERARTEDQRYQATALYARIECDAGHPKHEYRLVEKMRAMRPSDCRSLEALIRAAYCNGNVRLARKIAASLPPRDRSTDQSAANWKPRVRMPEALGDLTGGHPGIGVP